MERRFFLSLRIYVAYVSRLKAVGSSYHARAAKRLFSYVFLHATG